MQCCVLDLSHLLVLVLVDLGLGLVLEGSGLPLGLCLLQLLVLATSLLTSGVLNKYVCRPGARFSKNLRTNLGKTYDKV